MWWRSILVALLFIAFLAPSSSAQPTKVIIDADPGIDDSMAILFALSSEVLEVLGITTVFGNADIDTASSNALRLVELSGKDVPVYRGATEPLIVPLRPPPDFVHGADGIGNVEAPAPSRKAEPERADDFIVDG